MFELIQIGPKTYYITGITNVGVYRLNETDVCLIDSGNTPLLGKRVLKVVTNQGWNVKAIYNTHCHSDHVGAGAYIQEQTGCRIYANGSDNDYVRHTFLSPGFLYGGCPFPEIMGKELMAQPSDSTCLTPDNLPEGFEIIDLKGHSGAQVGYRTPDNIVFTGDAVIGESTIDALGTGYMYDFTVALESMERLKGIKAELFVPSHAEPVKDIVPLIDYNMAAIEKLCGRVCDFCSEKKSFEDVLAWFFEQYGHKADFYNYLSLGSTIRSLLTYLKQRGDIVPVFENYRLYWVKAQ